MSFVDSLTGIGRGTDPDTVEDQPVDDLAGLTTSDDDLFKMLKNPRRRRIIQHLNKHDTATVGELTERIAAAENDKDPANLDSQQRKRVYISLYQNHLPDLDDTGIVNYQSVGKHVEAREETTRLAALMDIVAAARGDGQ